MGTDRGFGRPMARRACLGRTPAYTFSLDYLSAMATPDEFFAIDMRVGTVVQAEAFPEARKPSIKLVIDFGAEIGQKRSSAQLTMHYTAEQLIGRQVVAAVNLGSRRIAGFM